MSLASSLVADVGEGAVEFVLTVENDGDEPVELTFSSGMTADVAVYPDGAVGHGDENADPDWRWSDERMFAQAVRTKRLEPGESLTVELVWSDPDPGRYTATATLAATDADVVERSTFVV